jgi:hypothetical protein
MYRAIGLLYRDLRDVAGGGQHEIGMVDPILATVRHPNDETLKRNRAQQITNALFHLLEGSTKGRFLSTGGEAGNRMYKSYWTYTSYKSDARGRSWTLL